MIYLNFVAAFMEKNQSLPVIQAFNECYNIPGFLLGEVKLIKGQGLVINFHTQAHAAAFIVKINHLG